MNRFLIATLVVLLIYSFSHAQTHIREHYSLAEDWKTIASTDSSAYTGFENPRYDDSHWATVAVPHNWDTYEGYRRLKHGNRHGSAWYRKPFTISAVIGKRYFIWFEGVGSYATVWLNGKYVGYHAGGRTTFTIDITEALNRQGKNNVLAVRADHPPSIRDLPWVCGGCSEEVGFSEGSQPMGIFRPAHLIVTNPLRIEPFGIHAWNDTTVSERNALITIETEMKNYGDTPKDVVINSRLIDAAGKTIVEVNSNRTIQPRQKLSVEQVTPVFNDVHLWSLDDPYCYRVVCRIVENGALIDEDSIVYGIRWVRWPEVGKPASKQFFLNGKPVFINGTAEYEHMMGNSHAFSDEQVRARVMQIKAAGFNAFRDAHQPHNLRYQRHWDRLGVLWWTQMAAHIWFDTPEFRENFKTLLVEWVKERRNSPSLVLWGLENESHLPKDFAVECSELIRNLDPTTSSQRKITTCNGGDGTDWDVPQNWTGTYGGNPLTYADDIQKQILIGEYGAWRSLDMHTEGPFRSNGPASENNMTQLMETKVRLAESVRTRCSGHFHWLFTSHENPGRVQGGEGFRELDRVGPINYKGLLTPWGEPVDAFYMYRSNYTSNDTQPMVYIVSHTWPDRWIAPGIKDSIVVYSNCDEVELFNDTNSLSFGKRTRNGIGTHFRWDHVNVRYNVLHAVGYVKGKAVANDHIILNHLPLSPNIEKLAGKYNHTLSPGRRLNYLYRVNCGGPAYVDTYGNTWLADRHRSDEQTWGSTSWTDEFSGLPAFFASQRKTRDRIKGTRDFPLFQTFRYGRDKLRYDFPVPNGDYIVELYFTEPWYGTGGGMDCTGWRLFDVAVNGNTMIKNLDIWKESGHDGVLKKTFSVSVDSGNISISFPKVASGQAIVSAIAIATTDRKKIVPQISTSLIKNLRGDGVSVQSWLDTGDRQYVDRDATFDQLPSRLYGAEWIRTSESLKAKHSRIHFSVNNNTEIYVALDARVAKVPQWLASFEDTKLRLSSVSSGRRYEFKLWRKIVDGGSSVELGSNDGTTGSDTLKMYTVVVVPVTTLQPAVDLRPTATYQIAEAKFAGDVAKADTLFGKACVSFSAEPNDSLQWTIALGVADFYALRVRYYHASKKSQRANLKIVATDGTIMTDENIEFVPISEQKWKVATTSTGTMINAGVYRVILTPINTEPLYVRNLEIQ